MELRSLEMSGEAVKKIDKKVLESASREDLIDLILRLVDEFSERERLYLERIRNLENEVRILKGEKKSPIFTTLRR
jgi:hypothetical protein